MARKKKRQILLTGLPAWGGVSFSPASVKPANIAFWLKTSRDLSGKDAQPVTTVTELKGMVLTQATASKQPRLYCGANGINGKAVIHADGQDLLVSASTLAGAKGAIFAIFRPTTVPQGSGVTLFSSADQASADRYFRLATHFTSDVISVIQVNADTYDIIRATTSPLFQNIPYCALLISTGAAYSFRVNGVVQTLTIGSGANNGDWFDDTSARDNTVLFGLKTSSEGFAWIGDFSELIVWNDVDLTAADVAILESYAKREYAIALTANQISITTPKPYATYQRDGSDQASIAITGTYAGSPTTIEARWNGGAWIELDAAPAGNAFTGTLSSVQAVSGSAQGDLEVRFSNATSVVAKAKYIGIGDVIGGGGQSNMGGRGTNYQAYSSAAGYKATMYGNDDRWKELIDPWDALWDEVGSASGDYPLSGGSFLPILATAIMNQTGFPVCFVPGGARRIDDRAMGAGASHIDRATLYGNLNVRMGAGATLCIMWEGESDVVAGTSQAVFNAAVDTISDAVFTDRGIKTMWAHIQGLSAYSPGYNEATVNAAITEAEGDNGNVKAGPNFSDLTPAGDHLHFATDAELATVAARWATKIIAAMGW